MTLRSLSSFIPTADELLNIDLPRLGGILLLHLKSYEGLNTVFQNGRFNRSYFIAMLENRNVGLGTLPHKEPEYGAKQSAVVRAMLEAWNWLERDGMLIRDPQQSADWFTISRRGDELIKQAHRFEQWEKLGINRVKSDLESTGGTRVVGGTLEVQDLAWKWVQMKEAQATTIASAHAGASAPVEQEGTPKASANDEPNATEQGPVAFISYSWDSESHKQWVLSLAERLQAKGGVQVILDRWHLHPGGDRAVFIEESVTKSKFVILICTPDYSKKANDRRGGVGYEAMIITGELAEKINERKFIPVLRTGDWSVSLPVWIKTKFGVDLRNDPFSEEEYENLLRALHNETLKPPPVGPKPMFTNGSAVAQEVLPPARALRPARDLTPHDREAIRRKISVVRVNAWHPRLTVWLTNRSDSEVRVKSVSLWHSNAGRDHKRLCYAAPSDNREFVDLGSHRENIPILFVTDDDAMLKLQTLGIVARHLPTYTFSDDVDVEVRVEYDLLGVEDEYRETIRVTVHGNRQIESV